MAACGSTALAQSGAVRGTIRFDTGRPFANAAVWMLSGQILRNTRTDSLGRFQLGNVASGALTIEVLCRSASSIVAPVAVRGVVLVDAEREAEFDAIVGRNACAPIPPRDAHVHWRGWYSVGFESSSFRPCPVDTLSREVLAYGHPLGRWVWIDWPSTAWRQPRLDTLATDSASGVAYGFVEWSGTLHGPAPAGHLDGANYRLIVDSVFAILPRGRC